MSEAMKSDHIVVNRNDTEIVCTVCAKLTAYHTPEPLDTYKARKKRFRAAHKDCKKK